MITVYGRKTSSNVQAVMWCIGELGLEHERLDYGLSFGGLDTPEYLAMNPHGLVPTVRDGDLVVWESCAINRYLAAKYGSGPFWPEDPAQRAVVDMWAEWAKVKLGAGFTYPIFWSRVRTAAKDRDEAALTSAIAAFEDHLDLVETEVAKGGFMVGDTLTMADIAVGYLLYRWFTMDIPRKARPVIEVYYARLSDRPAYQEHVMVPYDAMKVAGA